jgi:hypothetical protein
MDPQGGDYHLDAKVRRTYILGTQGVLVGMRVRIGLIVGGLLFLIGVVDEVLHAAHFIELIDYLLPARAENVLSVKTNFVVIVVGLLLMALAWADHKREEPKAQEENSPRVKGVTSPAAVVAEVLPEDPRIYLEFDPEWGSKEGHLAFSTPILLSNRGGSDAHNVDVAKISLRATEVTFGTPIPVIAKGEIGQALPLVAELNGIFRRNLVWPLNQEWESYQSLARETVEIPMRIAYRSFGGKQIETRCVLVFNGLISALNKPGKVQRNPVEFHGYEFSVHGSKSGTGLG